MAKARAHTFANFVQMGGVVYKIDVYRSTDPRQTSFLARIAAMWTKLTFIGARDQIIDIGPRTTGSGDKHP